MNTFWRESRRFLVIIGVAAAAAGLVAVAVTLGYYGRGSHYDACDPNQPWWNSGWVLLAPLTGILSIVAGCRARVPGQRLLASRALMIIGGFGLIFWTVWFAGRLWVLGGGCGLL